tara:strand:+ start:411 stop:692 length:282 start_codon:yes stop_codon:yes gene_type:complete
MNMQTDLLPLGFIQGLGGMEIALIFVVILLFFGPKKLPDLFRSFGKSIKEFKKASTEIEDDIRTAMEAEPETKPEISSEKELNLKEDSTSHGK